MANWELILDLGEKAGATPANRKKWRQRGFVPGSWPMKLLRLAKEEGIDLPPEAIPTREPRRAA